MSATSINKPRIKLSLIAIIIIAVHSLMFQDYWKSWKSDQTQFVYDVNHYYSYLPGTFIHKDLRFNYPNTFLMSTAPDGSNVQRGTCGMAIMYLPWFLLGHKIAINTNNSNAVLDGYSKPYSQMVHYGTLFYSILAFLFLRSSLARFFSDAVVSMTLLCLFFGTNLFYYTLSEGEMTHSYLFFLNCVLIWLIIKWHETPKFKFSIWIGFVIGLTTLIRPTEILVSLVFLLYGVTSFKALKEKGLLLMRQWKHLLVIAFFFMLILSPQLIYWKWITGDYLFFTYTNERFYFSDPAIGKLFFSYRKGWLVYTPLMVFSLLGMLFGKKLFPKLNTGLLIYFTVNVYFISCWWCWWYGGGLGMRSLVQSYAFLAFFLAAFIYKIMSLDLKIKPIEMGIKYLTIGLFSSLVFLNLIQTYQGNKHMIHYDSMTKQSYWIVFGKFEIGGKDSENYWTHLVAPDYGQAMIGNRKQW